MISKVVSVSSLTKLSKCLKRAENGLFSASITSLDSLKQDVETFAFDPSVYSSSSKVRRIDISDKARAIFIEEYEKSDDQDSYEMVGRKGLVSSLTSNEIENVMYDPLTGKLIANVILEDSMILAGSFNPLHHGHTGLIDRATETVEEDKAGSLMRVFELSVTNCAKSGLGEEELYERTRQFIQAKRALLITNKPYFREKLASVGPGCWFCVGADTFKRFFDLQFYEGKEQVDEFAEFLMKKGVKLVVGPRAMKANLEKSEDFMEMVPVSYRSQVREVHDFRIDVSSTELREKKKKENEESGSSAQDL